jgi:hypothetical protein
LRYQRELDLKIQREIEGEYATLIDPEYQRQFLTIEITLYQKLDGIQMPQPLDLDGKILVAIRHHLDSLPDIISHERSELLTKWEVLCDEEDIRHRQLLFAHLRDQQNEHHSDVDGSVASELDQQIGELSDELHTMELLAPTLSFEGDSTKTQQQHQAELNCLRNERKCRVREAENQSQEVRSLLSHNIKEETSRIAGEMRHEAEEFERVRQQSCDESEKRRLRRKEVINEPARASEEIVNGFGRQCMVRETDFRLACRTLREQIEHMKLSVASADVEFGCARREAEMRREVEIGRLESQMRAESELQRKPMSDQHLDVRIIERTKNRNRARDMFLSKPGRKEEQNWIKRLERHLAVVTQQLAALGKELIQYRHQLVAQEGEYNCRFGADPTVAVLAPKSPRRRPTTMFANRLPRLSS